jgi:hypothetical protein
MGWDGGRSRGSQTMYAHFTLDAQKPGLDELDAQKPGLNERIQKDHHQGGCICNIAVHNHLAPRHARAGGAPHPLALQTPQTTNSSAPHSSTC